MNAHSPSQCPKTSFQDDDRRPPLSSYSNLHNAISFKQVLHPLNLLKKITLTHVQDLKSDNVLMALRDQSVLDAVAQDEMNSPLPQKKLEDRAIYLLRNDFGSQAKGL